MITSDRSQASTRQDTAQQDQPSAAWEAADRNRAEEALKVSEARYRLVFEQNLASVILSTPTGKILDCNDSVAHLLGYDSRDEVRALSAWELYWDRVDRNGMLAQLRRDRSLGDYEIRFRRKDGRSVWTLANLSLVEDREGEVIHCTLIDITQRRQTEEALRQSEQRFRAVFDHTFELLALLRPDGTLVEANRPALEFRGFSLAEVVGLPLWETPWLVTSEHGQQQVRRAVATAAGGLFVRDEIRVADQAGSLRTFDFSVTPAYDEQGAVAFLVAEARDITDRKRLEEQYRQAQKMEAVGRLAGGVAHDFNNLLTVIIGYGELLLTQLAQEDPVRELVQAMTVAGDRAASLTRQLLAFSRQQIVLPQTLDLKATVADTDKLLRRVIGEDIELVSVSDPKLGAVRADPGQIVQVLMNLAINARDAMPTGGKLTIETRNVEFDPGYVQEHAGVGQGSYVLLAVSDTGHGIPADVLPHIWEPFFTTKGPAAGTGLGLAVVHGVVKGAGGHVQVYSEPGQGTVFKLYFPRVADPATAGESRSPTRVMPQGTEAVLLVEDEEAVRTLSRTVLRSCGYRVLDAGNGEEALRLAETEPGRVDLLITDVVMPQVGGRELAERLTRRWPGLKVLYVSGYTDDAVVRHGILQREVAFLGKPFTGQVLAHKVREVLDQPGPGDPVGAD